VRFPRPTAIVLGLTVAASVGFTACDTGDGKDLRPVDPDTTTTSTIAPAGTSVGSGAIETGPLPSLPLDEDDAGAPIDTGLGGSSDDPVTDEDSFELFTPWVDGSPIDERYTCDGDDVSPPLSWRSPPAGTVQLAFSMVDESASDGDGPFVHWVLAGVDPGEISLLEDTVPSGAVQAENSFGAVGWEGPCPPEGEPAHIYRFAMYALNQQVELADGTPANEFLDYIEQLAITSTEVTATYRR
jgi:Raf kinase inhibitor-like YbhB/YbcL family protein